MNFISPENLNTWLQYPQNTSQAATNNAPLQKKVLADYISDAVIFTDMDLHIQYLNSKAEQIYGITGQEVTGRLFSDVIHYKYINGSREEAWQSMQENGTWQGKVIYTRADNRQFYLLATVIFARNEAAKPVGLIATLKDITAEELMNEKARRKNVEQQKLINQVMIKAQESERNELGRELHDNINQILAAVKLQLEYGLENYEEGKATIERCKANIEEVITEIRNLSHRLVLPRFAETTLKTELHKTIDNICQQQPVELKLEALNEKNISDNIKETIYRIAQEQLTNIIKHAKASRVVVTLQNDAVAVCLRIEDDGIGFNTHQSRKGVGINNILNRVESFGGTAQLLSAPGKGCRLEVTIPLKNGNE